MGKIYEGIFELASIDVKPSGKGGNILKLVFEIPQDIEEEIKLIPLRSNNVKATITQEVVENEKNRITIEDEFFLYEVRVTPHKSDILRFSLHQEHTKAKEIKIVPLRNDNCKVFLQSIEQELDFEEE